MLSSISRRRMLTLGAAAAAVAALPAPALARLNGRHERTLDFYNMHTGERLSTVYWAQGEYVPDALSEIDYILRDFRTGDVKKIDPSLLDLLSALRRSMGTSREFDVISGYRSPRTNAMLRRTGGGGVAKHSLHMRGMAIDIRLPGRSLSELRKAAVALKRGGVGYYPDPGFVHVDTGRVRYW